MKSKVLLLSLLVMIGAVGATCDITTITPTPILFKKVIDLNDEVVQLYIDCSEGANYVSTKESCDPELLSNKVVELRVLSREFISADRKQPHGYDIYLETTMIYFRIGIRNLDEYTEAEKMARMFFEVQKATSGKSLVIATYHWVIFTSNKSIEQYYRYRLTLDEDRKSTLLLAQGSGLGIVTDIKEPRLSMLRTALVQLKFVIASIPESE